jgi:hypothetical protein
MFKMSKTHVHQREKHMLALDSTQQAKAIIAAIRHPHIPRSHGHHAKGVIE